MTVHGAKGLEAPVVFCGHDVVAGRHPAPESASSAAATPRQCAGRGGLGRKEGRRSAAVAPARAMIGETEDEYRRLLYVAIHAPPIG